MFGEGEESPCQPTATTPQRVLRFFLLSKDSEGFLKVSISKIILGGVGCSLEGEKPLAGNRDNHTEGFEGFPIILKDFSDFQLKGKHKTYYTKFINDLK